MLTLAIVLHLSSDGNFVDNCSNVFFIEPVCDALVVYFKTVSGFDWSLIPSWSPFAL